MTALRSRAAGLLREPLLQFLLLGAGLFLLYQLVSPNPEVPTNRIVVDRAQVMRLAQQFERSWLRRPTRVELDGLIEEHVTEEILYREALALGLEKNDLVIRRRLRQKMDFLNEDLAAQRQPTEAELQSYLDAHPGKFATPARMTFRQVYVKPSRDPGAARVDVEALRERLQRGEVDPDKVGDATLLPRAMDNADAQEVARSFGEEFVAALEKIPDGPGWHGPIRTGYGLHLVNVSARSSGGPLPLAAVRTAVEHEWAAARRAEAKARFYQELRKRYAVSIDVTGPDRAAALAK